MTLSIVIVNYKAWGHIEKAMAALEPGMPADWEVIIVDNATDGPALQAFAGRHPRVQLVANPDNSGFGMGCRLGVARSRGEWLLFMNPDVIAAAPQIEALLAEQAAHPGVSLLAPRQVGLDGRAQKVFDEFPAVLNQSKTLKFILKSIFPGRRPDPHATHGELVECDWVTGSCLLISRVDYDRIGGWSTDYWMYVEDADLCRRARDAGLRVAYTPRIEVVHAHGGSSRINVATRSLTKLEVIISKHVYVQNHLEGLRRLAAHALIGGLRLPGLALGTLLDLATLRRFPVLRVRTNILAALIRHYRTVLATGCWLSPRALDNQARQS